MTKLVPATLKDTVDRLRDDVVNIFERWLPERKTEMRSAVPGLWAPSLLSDGGPAIDVEEDDSAIRVTAELPGLSEEDFNVELVGDHLVLRGEKKSSREETKRNYYYAECNYGSFYRSIPLPCEVKLDKAEGQFKNGVLRLMLPKTDDAKAKRIKVNVS